jgi:hypothetical protein
VFPLPTRRDRQLTELIQRVPGARPLNGEASLLEAPCVTSDGVPFSLRVCVFSPVLSLPPRPRCFVTRATMCIIPNSALPLGFPVEPPELSVTLTVRHPWVDPASRGVNYTASRPWREGSSLAALVGDVQAALAATGKAPEGHARVGNSSSSGAGQASPVAGLMRTLSLDGGDTCVAALNALTSAQLVGCLAEPSVHFLPLCLAAAKRSEAAALTASLRASNAAAAQLNVSLAQEAADLRAQSAIIRSTDFNPAKQRYDAAAAQQAELVARVSVPGLVQQLQVAASRDEAESEALEASFLGGQLAADQFARQHKALRARYHLRMLKRAAAVA